MTGRYHHLPPVPPIGQGHGGVDPTAVFVKAVIRELNTLARLDKALGSRLCGETFLDLLFALSDTVNAFRRINAIHTQGHDLEGRSGPGGDANLDGISINGPDHEGHEGREQELHAIFPKC